MAVGLIAHYSQSPLVLGEGALSHLQERVCGVLMPSESSHPHASPRGPKRISKMVVRMHIRAQPHLLGHRSLRNKCKPGSELTESTQGPFTAASSHARLLGNTFSTVPGWFTIQALFLLISLLVSLPRFPGLTGECSGRKALPWGL